MKRDRKCASQGFFGTTGTGCCWSEGAHDTDTRDTCPRAAACCTYYQVSEVHLNKAAQASMTVTVTMTMTMA